jgi:hypothetical protein
MGNCSLGVPGLAKCRRLRLPAAIGGLFVGSRRRSNSSDLVGDLHSPPLMERFIRTKRGFPGNKCLKPVGGQIIFMPVGKTGTDFPILSSSQGSGIVTRGGAGDSGTACRLMRGMGGFCATPRLDVLRQPPRIRVGNHNGYATTEWECWGAL